MRGCKSCLKSAALNAMLSAFLFSVLYLDYGCYHSGILMEGVTRSQEFVTVRLSRQWKMHQAILGVGEGVKTEI